MAILPKTNFQSCSKLLEKVFPIRSTFLRNKTISETTPLRKEIRFLQFNVVSYKRPGIRLFLNTQQHCFQGKGEREEPVQLWCLEKCPPSIQFSLSFVQDCWFLALKDFHSFHPLLKRESWQSDTTSIPLNGIVTEQYIILQNFFYCFLIIYTSLQKLKSNLLLATQMNLVRYFWSQERDALNLLCVPRATKACNSRIDKPIQNTNESILSVIKTGKSPYLPTNGRNDEVNEF